MTRQGVLIAAVGLLAAAPVAAQESDLSEVPVVAFEVAGKVYMLQGAGGNIGVSSGPDGVLIVDDQFAPLAPKIKAKLADIGPGKLRLVVNTHWHGDHVGSNAVLGKEATIVAQENVRKRMKAGNPWSEPAVPEALPILTFEHEVTIHFNGEEIRVTHLPAGHSDGDSVVWFTGSNVVHMGDLFFSGHFPFIDLDSGGSVDGLIQAVDTVLAKLPEGARIIPGHGPVSGRKELEAYRAMLVESRDLVRDRKKRGLTLEQVQEQGLPEKLAGFGWEPMTAERWVETLYRDVKP
jgi:glyoxylase-like metal-dependent hydrolase (beta-lactamase superfamily II)